MRLTATTKKILKIYVTVLIHLGPEKIQKSDSMQVTNAWTNVCYQQIFDFQLPNNQYYDFS
jgi:hypothetical protein